MVTTTYDITIHKALYGGPAIKVVKLLNKCSG